MTLTLREKVGIVVAAFGIVVGLWAGLVLVFTAGPQ